MPDLNCRDADINGYGCISSQFVDSLSSTKVSDTGEAVGDPQWFGKITRFRYQLQLPDGTPLADTVVARAIANKQITQCILLNVQYTTDPVDPNITYAEGELEVRAEEGSPLPSSQPGQPYKFKHTLLRVWRITETKLRD
jgi:hypothetical protein